MEPRITIVTLGVDDLERSLAFYREGLGLPSQGIVGQEFEYGAVAFFELRGGVRLALFPRQQHRPRRRRAARPAQRDRDEHRPQRAQHRRGRRADGARRARRRPDRQAGRPDLLGGYAGYFADPDGHLWEIAFNPDIPIDG